MNEELFERCSCGNAMTGVYPGEPPAAPAGPPIVAVCSSCDYVAGSGGPPIVGRNLHLIRNTRWQ